MFKMITMEKALELMLERVRPLETTTVDLLTATGMAAGEQVTASWSLPTFDKSPLDGYALRADDTANANATEHVVLEVVERIHAGELPRRTVRPGTAIAVDTGAPIPPGADCVVRLEETVGDGNRVRIKRKLESGENVIRVGEDIGCGEVAIGKGQRIGARVVGLLAGLGLDRVKVFRQPRVAVFCTGNEFADAGRPPEPGRIHLSNLYALGAYVKELGGESLLLDRVPDNRDMVAARILEGVACAHLVLSSGGISVGAGDLVLEAVAATGAEVVYRQIGFKPGGRVVFAEKDGRFIINLSGNPSAAWVSFVLLVRPVLLRLAGFCDLSLRRVKGVMAEPFPKSSGQRRFLMASVVWHEDRYRAGLSGWQSPASLRSPAACNALIDIPAGHGSLAVGEEVDLLLLPVAS